MAAARDPAVPPPRRPLPRYARVAAAPAPAARDPAVPPPRRPLPRYARVAAAPAPAARDPAVPPPCCPHVPPALETGRAAVPAVRRTVGQETSLSRPRSIRQSGAERGSDPHGARPARARLRAPGRHQLPQILPQICCSPDPPRSSPRTSTGRGPACGTSC